MTIEQVEEMQWRLLTYDWTTDQDLFNLELVKNEIRRRTNE